MVQRQVVNDTRGHVSELLSKCIAQGALSSELGAEDRDRMMSFLRMYGPLDKAGKYTGSERAGYKRLPGAGDELGTLNQPIDMRTLLDENFWGAIMFEEVFDMQATMFQPVGGMDRIAYAFAKQLGSTVRIWSRVKEIRKTSSGARIVYTEAGAQKSLDADYCLCGMPLSILKKIPNDFSAPIKQVIEQCTYAQRLQDCLGKPPILGAGLQHLRRSGIRQRRMQPHLVSFRGLVHPTRRAGERIHR